MIEDIFLILFSFLSFLIIFGILERIRFFTKNINLVISIVSCLTILLILYLYSDTIKVFFSLFAIIFLLIFIVASFLGYWKKFKY
ncbi:MAG: hypothetical protein QXI09_00765 [Candidatus Aenigmatarchaeota archaeon]